MTTTTLVLLLVLVGALTYLYRYAMIGLFASRSLPGWLHALCRHIAPASFAALTLVAAWLWWRWRKKTRPKATQPSAWWPPPC